MKSFVLSKSFLAAGALLLSSAQVFASPISLDFTRVTNNSSQNVASQFSVNVFNQADAFSILNQSIGATDVLFTFKNAVGIASNIAEIYFDDSNFLLSQYAPFLNLGGTTDFGTTLNPSNLPSGNTIGFVATSGFGADVNPGNPNNGINASNDLLGIRIALQTGVSFLDLGRGLQDDLLRIGLHVRSIGADGESDSFVSNGETAGGGGLGSPVPLPAAAWMFLTGLVGFLGLQRRRTAV
ncbi:VPLPA-CTERM sorting domain-containing protein [Methylomonas sp. EFPC1]|uniref:VPLPA-CTERM sorting domain-containing protein n=1 Tax=Methylomonas sp. EFPC1 TaxID=2812647 RepID=UPI0019674133|nr:VPLPA-CTERM sorting domain-containing protein [Methylomonas sp. EFPC1]QSB01518.1 VPLPA-CTERM sorting domain-containing protein [Methylomonas sp. EFPC1]